MLTDDTLRTQLAELADQSVTRAKTAKLAIDGAGRQRRRRIGAIAALTLGASATAAGLLVVLPGRQHEAVVRVAVSPEASPNPTTSGTPVPAVPFALQTRAVPQKLPPGYTLAAGSYLDYSPGLHPASNAPPWEPDPSRNGRYISHWETKISYTGPAASQQARQAMTVDLEEAPSTPSTLPALSPGQSAVPFTVMGVTGSVVHNDNYPAQRLLWNKDGVSYEMDGEGILIDGKPTGTPIDVIIAMARSMQQSG